MNVPSGYETCFERTFASAMKTAPTWNLKLHEDSPEHGSLLVERFFAGEYFPATFNVRGLSLPDQTALSCGAILIGCPYPFIARW